MMHLSHNARTGRPPELIATIGRSHSMENLRLERFNSHLADERRLRLRWSPTEEVLIMYESVCCLFLNAGQKPPSSIRTLRSRPTTAIVIEGLVSRVGPWEGTIFFTISFEPALDELQGSGNEAST